MPKHLSLVSQNDQNSNIFLNSILQSFESILHKRGVYNEILNVLEIIIMVSHVYRSVWSGNDMCNFLFSLSFCNGSDYRRQVMML